MLHHQKSRRGRPNAWLSIAVVVIAILAAVASYATSPQSKQTAALPPKRPAVRKAYGHLPLSFEENLGQTDARVKFLARGRGYSLFLTSTEAVLELRAPSSSSSARRPRSGKILPVGMHSEPDQVSLVRIRLEGANPNSSAVGVNRLSGKVNYFVGKDAAKWHKNVPTFAGVKFREIYPGIDVIYRGTEGRLEYDLAVAPGADPDRIKLRVDGADSLSLTPDGDLIIKTASGNIVEKTPAIYQEAGSMKHPVRGGYVLCGKDGVAFKFAAYDKSQPLIIDPLMTYSTYLGGSVIAESNAIAVDANGAAWVTGDTTSTDFPISADALQSNNAGNADIFISKLSPDGSTLEFSTYLGGSSWDYVERIALDPAGGVYVAGFTESTDYPVTMGAFQTTFLSSGLNSFVTALDSNGGLSYSTFLGTGPAIMGIAADSHGDLMVYGAGNNGKVSYQSCPSAGGCSFLVKLNPTGSALLSSSIFSLLPNQGTRGGNLLGMDAQKNVYLAGISGYRVSGNGVFVAKLNSDGSNLLYEREFFYSSNVIPIDMAVEASGNLHLVIGVGGQNDQTYPLINLTPTGDATTVDLPLKYHGLALPFAFPFGMAVDSDGNLIIVGGAGPGLLTSPGAFQPNFGGEVEDAFLMKLDPSGQFALYTTYLGGSHEEVASSVAVDSSGNAYVTGVTDSSDFPVTAGAYQTTFKGQPDDPGFDAFVARIVPFPTLSPTATATPPIIPTPTATPTATPVGLLIYSPSALRFPAKRVGAISAPKFVTVTNPRKNRAPISITGVALKSRTPSGFNIDIYRTTCAAGLSVAAGKSCKVAIVFAPTASGPASDDLMITGEMSNSAPVALIGTGG